MYKVICTRGRGGFGVVEEVLANDGSGSRFARKTLSINQSFHPDEDFTEQLKRRFIREANLQSGMSHPNVVPILKTFLKEDPPSFIMPLAISSVADDMKKNKTMNDGFMHMLTDVMAALEYIHGVEIFHRDLKPENILRFKNEHGKNYFAVSDFGLMALKQTQVSTLTTVGMTKTADFYTAPEITQDFSKASPGCDIYSLGCLLHDFVGVNDRIPCSEIREESPYSAILLSCTRRDPSRRFKSVAAVRDALLQVTPGVAPFTMTADAAAIVNELTSPNPLSQAQWEKIAEFVDDHEGEDEGYQVLRALTRERIQELITTAQSNTAATIGTCYAEWIREGSFDFDSCDGLAIRVKELLEIKDLGVQSDLLVALLLMGTSHNRWYVQRLFARLAGPDLAIPLAERLSIEFRADSEKINKAINHMEWSVEILKDALHPKLQLALH